MKSFSSLFVLTEGSLAMTPVPVAVSTEQTEGQYDGLTGAGGIKQDPVETTHHAGELASIVIAHNSVPRTETVNVADKTLGTLLVGIVRKDDTSVLHQRRHVCCLATGSRGHLPFR